MRRETASAPGRLSRTGGTARSRAHRAACGRGVSGGARGLGRSMSPSMVKPDGDLNEPGA